MFFHQLLGLRMCGQCFILGLFKKSKSFLESRDESLSDLWVISWFISEDEAKQGFLGG